MSEDLTGEFIIKGHHSDNFAMISNSTLCDARLSFKSRGILCYLLSKPTDWRTILKDLVNQSPDGRASVVAGLNELEALGYLKRVLRPKVAGKYTGFNIYVHEMPVSPDETANDNQTLTGADFQLAENQPLQRKKEQKKELQRKKENLSISDPDITPVDLTEVRRRNDEIFGRNRAS